AMGLPAREAETMVEDAKTVMDEHQAKEDAIPPPKEGMVRLYRGEKEGGDKTAAEKDSTWFTPDLDTAGTYGPDIKYVDVPEAVAKEYLAGTQAGRLPKEWADQAKPHSKGEKIPTYGVTEHAAEEGKVEEDNQPQHQRTDAPRVEEAQPQADRGDRPVPSAEEPEEAKVAKSIGPARSARLRQLIQKKNSDTPLTDVETKDLARLKTEVSKAREELAAKEPSPNAFKPLPEGLDPKRWVTPQETLAVLREAGLDDEAAAGIAGDKPISINALRARLTKFMGGQKYADSVLSDVLVRGGKQSGHVDQKLLRTMAAVGLTGSVGISSYALTGDKSKAIEAAVWMGGGFAAIAAVGRLG